MTAFRVLCDDALAALSRMEPGSLDALVTDPPAGIAFMGRAWDGDKGGRDEWVAWLAAIMREALRVLKPGAHGLVWALPRTQHWTATALEDAGFEIRDTVTHLFGSGFPKSMNVAKAVDAALGVEGGLGDPKSAAHAGWIARGRIHGADSESGWKRPFDSTEEGVNRTARVYLPGSPEARRWDGWGTALKPAAETWVLVRKPLAGKGVARNLLAHGVGALNIDASRIGDEEIATIHTTGGYRQRMGGAEGFGGTGERSTHTGRYPANVVLSHHPLCEEIGTVRVAGDPRAARNEARGARPGGFADVGAPNGDRAPCGPVYGETEASAWDCVPGCAARGLEAQEPGASRYFYVAKPTKDEKQAAVRTLSLFDSPAKAFACGCKESRRWESADRKADTLAGTEPSPQPATIASAIRRQDGIEWPTTSCGNEQTGLFPQDARSITSTKISRITSSETCDSSTVSRTSGSTGDANCAVAFGGNLAGSATNSSRSTPRIGISTETASSATDDAGNAISPRSSSENEFCDKCGGIKVFHPTVKPVALMRYLCKLVTPPGGVILDPFAGSGTTGVAAIMEGFTAIMVERDPVSASTAAARCERTAKERGVA